MSRCTHEDMLNAESCKCTEKFIAHEPTDGPAERCGVVVAVMYCVFFAKILRISKARKMNGLRRFVCAQAFVFQSKHTHTHTTDLTRRDHADDER